MVSFRLLSLGAFVAVAVSVSDHSDASLAALLRRQAPGSPQFNCHDNCGQALIASRGADPCSSNIFLTDYKACIQCAGPDNSNIWSIYGPRLSAAGGKCGLPTEPASGVQPAVEAAIPAASGSAAPTGPPTGAPTPPPTTPPATPTGSGSASTTKTTPAVQTTNAAARAAGDYLGVLAVGALGAAFVGIQ